MTTLSWLNIFISSRFNIYLHFQKRLLDYQIQNVYISRQAVQGWLIHYRSRWLVIKRGHEKKTIKIGLEKNEKQMKPFRFVIYDTVNQCV